MLSWVQVSRVPLQQWRPTVYCTVSKTIESRSREVISFYLALMGLHLELCVQFWYLPQYKKGISKGRNSALFLSRSLSCLHCIYLLHSYNKPLAQSSAVIRVIQLFFLPVTRYFQEEGLGSSLLVHEQQFHTVNVTLWISWLPALWISFL